MDFKIFQLSFFVIICYLLPQNLCWSKPIWSQNYLQNKINGYLANLDIRIPQEMIAEMVDNKMTDISKPQWSQNDINGYLANLDIKIPQEMIAEIVDKKMTGISIAKTFDKYQGLMKKKEKKNYIPYIIYKVTFA